MRNRKGGMNRLAAYIIGPAVALFVLVGLFSLLPYEWMTTQWPLAIAPEEVATYQRWFDHRPGEAAAAEVPVLALNGTVGDAPGEQAIRLGDAEVRATAYRQGDRYRVEVKGDTGLQGMHGFDLVPINAGLVRLMYLQQVAVEHMALVPEVRLVEVEEAGDDRGVHLLVERLTDQRLQRAGMDAAKLFRTGKQDAAGPQALALAALKSGEREALDTNAAALHAWFVAAGFGTHLDSVRFELEPYAGRLLPVLGFAANGATDPDEAWSATAYPIADRWRAAMAADRDAWLARLAAIDAQWAPALANGGSTAFLEAGLQQQREAFLAALLAPARPPALPKPAARGALDPWLKPYLGADDTLRFSRGKYRLERTVVCPPGMGVVLEKGARFTVEPGASWVINGPLHIRGTRLNPVFIRPADPAAAYGAIAVNGTGATRCRVQGLRMSGGAGTTSDGRQHPAMLSFHDCDLVLESSELGEAAGTRALDVRGGTVRMADMQVQGGIGLGRVSGSLLRSVFGTGVANADAPVAVRLEGGQVALLDCRFTGPYAPGVAAGNRARVLVRGSRFEGCATAVDATEGAFAHVEQCSLDGVAVPWRAGGASVLRGGGRIELRQNTTAGAAREEDRSGLGVIRSVDGMDSLMVRLFGSVR